MDDDVRDEMRQTQRSKDRRLTAIAGWRVVIEKSAKSMIFLNYLYLKNWK